MKVYIAVQPMVINAQTNKEISPRILGVFKKEQDAWKAACAPDVEFGNVIEEVIK